MEGVKTILPPHPRSNVTDEKKMIHFNDFNKKAIIISLLVSPPQSQGLPAW